MNIGILTGSSSDKHLSEPVYDEIKKLGMKPSFISLRQNNIVDSFIDTVNILKQFKFDFILAVADRPEQMGGVLAAFHNKIPIGHLYAGDHNTIATFDDKHRHAITLYSGIQFCSCPESAYHVDELMRGAGLVPDSNVVGATHFNGKNLEEIRTNEYGLHTHKPYILILINSETNGDDNKLIKETMSKLYYFFPDKHPCKFKFNIAKGNGDDEHIETKLFTEIMRKTDGGINIVRDNRQNHNFFLSLIANSYMFVTNSSSAIYEAPFLIPQSNIIHVGNRNKGRTRIPPESHNGKASIWVATLIKKFLETRS